MNALQQYFEKAGFSVAETARILQEFKLTTFEKGDYFIAEGKTSRHLGFVASGLFQYFLLKDGEEKTTYVSMENTFIASLLSYLQETPSHEYIRAITPGKVWMISKTAVVQLLEEIPAFKNFYVGLLEWQICCIDKSRLDLITLNSEQRYEKMIREEPHLIQQIPLQYLASILGVTPRHLSRIRKNIW